MENEIKKLIKDALENLNIEVSDIVLEHPEDLKNGDYSTNVALAIAKGVERNPKELAEKIVAELVRLNVDKNIEKVEIAGVGFINFYLSREFFSKSVEEILNQAADFGKNKILKGKKFMVEYTQPNPFKPFHIGHLMSNAIGESISRIVEFSGAETMRANCHSKHRFFPCPAILFSKLLFQAQLYCTNQNRCSIYQHALLILQVEVLFLLWIFDGVARFFNVSKNALT